MLIMLKLCNFGTIYLWLFVLKVLQVCTGQRVDDIRGGGGGGGRSGELLMKPYPYQMFDYTDDLLKNERSDSTLWQTPVKNKQHPADYERLHFAIQPKTGSGFEEGGGAEGVGRQPAGRSLTSSEITFENLNDFDMSNAIWPPPKYTDNGNMLLVQPQQQLQLRHRFPLPPLLAIPTNVLYDKPNIMTKRQYAKDKRRKTSLWDELHKDDNDADNSNGDDNDDDDDVDESDNDDDAKNSGFPLKDDDESITSTNGHTVISDSNTGKGNENSNYSDNSGAVQRNNYSTGSGNSDDKDMASATLAGKHKEAKKRAGRVRNKKPKQDMMTPYVPAISGGAMTNLGKFFRDLSKNVQFSEKYQWSSEDQKLLEGDPTFGNLHHHLSDPHITADQAGEWIKAIRFYRPSQKIRSLVAMNPHGQWAHGSHFIDPNYMWMGLGK